MDKNKQIIVAERTHKILISDRYNIFPARSFSIIATNMSSGDVLEALRELIKTHGLKIKVGD